MQPRDVLGIAQEEIASRLQISRHPAKKNILRFLIEINERIAKKDNVKEVIERPSCVHQIDALELDEPGAEVNPGSPVRVGAGREWLAVLTACGLCNDSSKVIAIE